MALYGLVYRGHHLCIRWVGPPQLLARPARREGQGQVASSRPHPESTYPPESPRGEEFKGWLCPSSCPAVEPPTAGDPFPSAQQGSRAQTPKPS